MRNKKPLLGTRIAVIAADGFEYVELVVPVRALRKAGAKVDVISLRPGRILGMNLHQPGGRVRVTRTLEHARVEEYHGLLIPGGFINPDLLRQSAQARAFVRAFDEARKPIATLCHGPWLLASAGVLDGRTVTSWPGIRDDLVNAGATWLDREVVFDRNWVSSRGPQDLAAFVKAARELFAGRADVASDRTGHEQSAPQRDEPPAAATATMRFLPGPALRAMLALGAGVWLATRTRQGQEVVERLTGAARSARRSV